MRRRALQRAVNPFRMYAVPRGNRSTRNAVRAAGNGSSGG